MIFKHGAPSHTAEFIVNIRTRLFKRTVPLLKNVFIANNREHHSKANCYFVTFPEIFFILHEESLLSSHRNYGKNWHCQFVEIVLLPTDWEKLWENHRSCHPSEVFYKYSHENNCVGVPLLKRDSATGVFPWILRNF